MNRVTDIIKELEVQVEPLREQKIKALEYINLNEELKELEISLIASDITNINYKYQENKNKIDELNKEIIKLTTNNTSNEAETSSYKLEINELDNENEAEEIRKTISDGLSQILDIEYETIYELSKKNLGCTLIATFGTEGTKSAVLTACRGYRSEDFPDGIDVDTGQFLSSLIPSERGFLWPLKDVVYGNKDKDRKPIAPFITEINQYPGLLDIAMAIEGLI